jgi:hypothetical protein
VGLKRLEPNLFHAIDNTLLQMPGRERGEPVANVRLCPADNTPIGKQNGKQAVSSRPRRNRTSDRLTVGSSRFTDVRVISFWHPLMDSFRKFGIFWDFRNP